jgi:glycosyltransferase involved in cell wall biosynthesis
MDGIGRYLQELLRRMIAKSKALGPPVTWYLYVRDPDDAATYASGQVKVRHDRLPTHLGRILSPVCSTPFFLVKDRPQVVWGPAHRLPLWVPKGTRTVVTIHDLAWLRVPKTMHPVGRWLDRTLMPFAVKRADRILAVSKSTAEDLQSHWPGISEKLRTIPLGVSQLPKPQALEALRLPVQSRRFFLFVGTLEPRKNLLRLFEAHARGLASRTDWPPLVIVGGAGWGLAPIEELLDRFGCRHGVCVLGRVSDQELSTLYANALALLMPSLYEGFGLPLAEASRAGTPVVASNVASMPEVVGDGGLLVDPLSVTSIFGAMEAVSSDEKLRELLCQRALEQSQRFSWDVTADQTLDALIGAATAQNR